jgi:hypothetical protein
VARQRSVFRHSYRAWIVRVFELSMTSPGPRQIPTAFLKEFNDFSNFHFTSAR